MTKIDLLARAKALGITGRHDMSKSDLEVAVRDAEMLERSTTVHENGVVEFNPQGEDRDQSNQDLRNTLETRARDLGINNPESLSLMDLTVAVHQRVQMSQVSDRQAEMAKELKAETTGTTRRKGTNLNTPWNRKFYYVSLSAYEAAKADGRVAKSAMQIQLLLKFMVERGITESSQAQQGGAIATVAVASGFLKTVIEPHVLFAYYRAKMERLGLVFAGYNLDTSEETEEDPEAAAEAADAEALEADLEGEGE